MANLLTPIGGKAKLFDESKLKAAIGKALDKAAKDATASFKKTVATWERKPQFLTSKDGEFARDVGTDNQIYDWTTHGTRPHVIRARNAPNLAFGVGFEPKTQPNVIGSFPGFVPDPSIFTKEVLHPGTEPRKFEQAIVKDNAPKLQRAMDEELRKALGG